MKKILLVYPQYPITFWSFKHALKFVSKKACFPPLGLLTVASLIPKEYDKKLVDMNVTKLKDEDIIEAEYVFISAMVIQKKSVRQVIDRCKKLGVKTVAGGPLFTSDYEEYKDVDHLVLGEGEVTLKKFFEDLKEGSAKRVYTTTELPDIRITPLPDWDLIDMKKYDSMCVQYSRGCPFDCEFCNITTLYGHKPRIKSSEQMIGELEDLYDRGWRGGVFFVDDNFIGNKLMLKQDLLSKLIAWMEEKDYPFTFTTEASVNLADDETLMNMMVRAGFQSVFVGIETPNEDSLNECNKKQNKNRDLLASVRKIQKFGMKVQGGFILGFDSDPDSIFEKMINFIQQSGIVTAMVGLLNAPKGTRLYNRMKNEGRLLKDMTGDNTDMTMNFVPKMDNDMLLDGYKKVLSKIYNPKYYYQRVISFLKNYKPIKTKKRKPKFSEVKAFFKSIFRLGIIGRERRYFWKVFFWSIFKNPRLFPTAISYMIYGFHFRKIYKINGKAV